MDSASLTSLTPILDGIDRWNELAPLLPIIISLELVLSADNAVALASITRRLENQDNHKIALNIGIMISLVLRVILILTAQFILSIWPIKLLAGLYLLSLFLNKFTSLFSMFSSSNNPTLSSKGKGALANTILILALTDLAFSIDSIAAAVAISDQILLVIIGALIGVLALRFTSGIFIKLLDKFERLEPAGYLAVGIVGLKLIINLLFPSLIFNEWLLFIIMVLVFMWGLSKNKISLSS
tara:strand:+ start:5193 stop:5912 length:720 start_codon:yes stop_codon:yes gene_type:complete